MKLNKEKFMKTEMGGELEETIRTWDKALDERRKATPGIGNPDQGLGFKYWDNTCRSCQDRWEVFKLAIKQFYGIEFFFTRTDVNQASGYFVVTEGNFGNAVKKRTISINGRYIRGFIAPKYDSDAAQSHPVQTPGKSTSTVAHEVIAGQWGNGDARKNALKAAGYDPAVIQAEVNKILNGSAATTTKPQSKDQPITKTVKSTCYAKSYDRSLAGTYKTTDALYCRNDAGSNKKALCVIPAGTEVHNYGYYTTYNGVKWLYITVTLDGVEYIGFSSKSYLKK